MLAIDNIIGRFIYITLLLCEINVNNNWMFSNCWVLEQCKLLIRFTLKLKLNINWVITKFDIENLIVMTHIQLTCPHLLTDCWPTHSTSLGSYWLLHLFCERNLFKWWNANSCIYIQFHFFYHIVCISIPSKTWTLYGEAYIGIHAA